MSSLHGRMVACVTLWDLWLYTHIIHVQTHKIREKFVADLEAKFPDLGLKFSIGKN